MRDRFSSCGFSVLTIMIVIALLAVGFAWLRPLTLTADEAERIATHRFQKTPGAGGMEGLSDTLHSDEPPELVRGFHQSGHWPAARADHGGPVGKPSTAYIPVPGGRASIAVPETLPTIPPPQP